MANQVDRITKVQIQQTDKTFGQPYAVGAEAQFVTLTDGTDVQTAISALQLANRKVIKQLGRKGKQLVITRMDGSTATLDLLWDRNTDVIAGIVDKTGGKANKGKVWKVGNDGKPGWGVQDKTKTSELDEFKPASSSAAGVKGLVPAPAKGQQAKYLRGDGKWVTPAGTIKNAIGQPGYCEATTTASSYYNTFWSVGHVPAGTTERQTNFPGWRNSAVTFIGATNNAAGRAGLVPPPPKGNETRFLCSNGGWKEAPKGIWKVNTTGQEGYVPAPGKDANNKFWGVNKNGTLGWTDFKDVNLYREGNFTSQNKNRNLLLCGDGSWRDINSIVTGDAGAKIVFANRCQVPNKTITLLPDNNKNWKLLTLSGAAMKGQYMAIANVSVDTRQWPFPLLTNNIIETKSYICPQTLQGYLRAVVNITTNPEQNKSLNDSNFGYAPSQNTITRYGGSVTTCYEWTYDGSETQYIYLAAEYNATRFPLWLCYNVIIVKLR